MFEAVLLPFVYILSFLFVIGLVVVIHEGGHYLVGRWCGIGAERFSIGFGPEIAGFTSKKEGTRFSLCAVPLGGYVKFVGDRDPSSAAPGEVDEAEQARAFHLKPVWARALTVAAGPAANFLLTIAILFALFLTFGEMRQSARVGEVMENSPAAEAGLQEGDLIVRAHGKEIDDFRDLQRVVALSANTPIDIVVQRAGERVTLTATPERRARPDAFGDEREIGYLGVGAAQGDQIQHERYGPFSAAGRATERTFELAGLQLRFLGRLITGRESVEELGGPLGIAHLSGRAASQSYEQAEQAPLGIANALLTLIQLTAAVSVSIGLINLFPIPILDGGHLLFYAYEAVRGRPVPPAVLEVGYRVGLALLLGVFLLATWSDLSRLGLFG